MMKHLICVLGLCLFVAPAMAADKAPVDMSWTEAEAYMRGQGYPVKPGRDGDSLRGEDGQRPSMVFQFAGPASPLPATCIGVFDIKPIDWRASVAAITGVPANKVPRSTKFTVSVNGRKIPVKVEKGSVGVYVGACD